MRRCTDWVAGRPSWGGVLLAADTFAHVFVWDTVTPKELLGLRPELWHVPGVVGIVLVLFGLIAIYLRRFQETGRLGLIGFVLSVVGIVIGAGFSMIFHTFFMHWRRFLRGSWMASFTGSSNLTGVGVLGCLGNRSSFADHRDELPGHGAGFATMAAYGAWI